VEVALSYLSPAAVDAYVAARVADPDSAAALAPVVYRRTDGHPLFMVQVTDSLLQAGEPLLAMPAALDALEQALPPGLRELIEAQLGRLSAEEQQVLEVESVAGAVFAVASVAAGLQGADVTIEVVCERLARRGLFLEERGLETWPDGTVSGRYGFRHALYQDVFYQRLGRGWQARLHRQMGERQAQAYGDRAREVAAELAVLPTSPRESRFFMAYSHPYEGNPMPWRQSCRSRPHCTRSTNWTNEPRSLSTGARRGHTPASAFPKRSGIRPSRWPRPCRPRAWPNSYGCA
jgi:hypothetical protein